MAKRESPATRSQRTSRRTKKEIEAGKANLAKGREAREQKRREAEAEGRDTGTVRWQKLLDGQLTVADLDDEEITRMRVKAKDGSFAGTPRRSMPSHLAQGFHREAIKRANDKIRTAAPEAVQALLDIGRDPDVKESDRVRALTYIIDRGMGKVPETINVQKADEWSATMDEAFKQGIDRDKVDE